MGSISGFKEYVNKDHPACPLCGGATDKIRFPDDTVSTKKGEVIPEFGSTRECINCGARNTDGKILNDPRSYGTFSKEAN